MNRELDAKIFKSVEDEQTEKYKRAVRMVKYVAEAIKGAMPELIQIINRFDYRETAMDIDISTDGEMVYINTSRVLKDYSDSGLRKITRKYLHMLFHIILGHVSENDIYNDKELWNAIVEQESNKLVNKLLGIKEDDRLFSYYHMRSHMKEAELLKKINRKCMKDNHDYWINAKGKESIHSAVIDLQMVLWGEELSCDKEIRLSQINNLLKDLEVNHISFNEVFGGDTYSIEKKIKSSRKRYEWKERLREVVKEVILEEESLDSIDKAIYSYGMDMYGNVAIIEPCEDEMLCRRARDITIAIDTSASCDGTVAQRFLSEMESILCDLKDYMKSEDRIEILECDADIKAHDSFTKDEIFEGCIQERYLHGFGGTSFIPAFEWVDNDQIHESNKSERTLLYLTDGYGVFPKHRPEFEVNFIIPSSEKNRYEVAKNIPEYINVIYMEKD